ncbi:MAG: hypothetical protein OEZ43_14660 [Gammaproteobacteria bacterium]|nr:hypothetical protein [Gammaproteobacteria bacterium]
MDFSLLDSSSSVFEGAKNIQVKDGRIRWLADDTIENIPVEVTDIGYINEAWDVSIPGIPSNRLLYQNEAGELVLLAIRSHSKTYWVRNDNTGEYGATWLSLAAIHPDSDILGDNLSLMSCQTTQCSVSGNIFWSTTYDSVETAETPYANIESHRFTQRLEININNENESSFFSVSENLWVYPPLGIVQRYMLGTFSNESTSMRIDVLVMLRTTNIKLEETPVTE